MTNNKIGVLLTQVGSPNALSLSAVKHYLKNFLSDKHVVNIPRFIWLPILYGYILRTRPPYTLNLYEKIWTKEGSPLTLTSQKLAELLAIELKVPVAIGMHYSDPSIQTALTQLEKQNVEKIIVLPLFPQYSTTTTAASRDQVNQYINQSRVVFIDHYYDQASYIETLAAEIKKNPFKHLLFSFHGIPKYYSLRGDPYEKQCHATARLIADKLQLRNDQWTISFQSRLGRARWLEPYTDKILAELPQKGITDLHVVCPGFPIDCLETLEEIAIRGREQFLQAGGKQFHYISALNATPAHVQLLASLIRSNLPLSK